MIRATCLAASCALAAAQAAAQTADVQDLGHGIYRAQGIRDAETRLK